MDANWRLTQGSGPAAAGGDWRAKIKPEGRSRVVTRIMGYMKNNLPVSLVLRPEGLDELQKIAARFEERIYNTATDKANYLRNISLRILAMETKTRQAPGNAQVIPNQNNPGQGKIMQGRPCKRTTDVLEEKYNLLPFVPHEDTITKQVLRASRRNSPSPALEALGLGDGDYYRGRDENYKLPEEPPVKKAKQSKGSDESKTKKGKDVAIDNLVAVKKEELETYKDVKTKQTESYRDMKMPKMEENDPHEDLYCIGNYIEKVKITRPRNKRTTMVDYLKESGSGDIHESGA